MIPHFDDSEGNMIASLELKQNHHQHLKTNNKNYQKRNNMVGRHGNMQKFSTPANMRNAGPHG